MLWSRGWVSAPSAPPTYDVMLGNPPAALQGSANPGRPFLEPPDSATAIPRLVALEQ